MRSMMRLLSGLSVLMLVFCSCVIAPVPNANTNDNAPIGNDNLANDNLANDNVVENENAPTNHNDNVTDDNKNDNTTPDNDNTAMDVVVFEDPETSFKTSDVRDIDGQIVRFDAAAEQMIWTEDDSRFEGWDIAGNKLQRGFFCILFGSEDGVQHAYFTETSTQTICNIVVTNGSLSIFSTSEKVPQN
jgi:hypothetical protein